MKLALHYTPEDYFRDPSCEMMEIGDAMNIVTILLCI